MILYSIAVDSAGNLIACQPDSPNDQLVRRDADAFLGEGMRFDEPYEIRRSLALVDDIPPGATVAFESNDNRALQCDGTMYRFAVTL